MRMVELAEQVCFAHKQVPLILLARRLWQHELERLTHAGCGFFHQPNLRHAAGAEGFDQLVALQFNRILFAFLGAVHQAFEQFERVFSAVFANIGRGGIFLNRAAANAALSYGGGCGRMNRFYFNLNQFAVLAFYPQAVFFFLRRLFGQFRFLQRLQASGANAFAVRFELCFLRLQLCAAGFAGRRNFNLKRKLAVRPKLKRIPVVNLMLVEPVLLCVLRAHVRGALADHATVEPGSVFTAEISYHDHRRSDVDQAVISRNRAFRKADGTGFFSAQNKGLLCRIAEGLSLMQASFYRNRNFAGHFIPPDSAAVRSGRRCKRLCAGVMPSRRKDLPFQRIIK
ncbi:hypothetical protein SDC9_90002 [bioreactor metagenome]|uniref:Uncharacterized protein n=1 Tax=bioreactor metagenome TaxID=1076179 RepID=A0A644ZQS2_9ZZZZ